MTQARKGIAAGSGTSPARANPAAVSPMVKFRTVCSVIEEIYHAAEAQGDASIMGKAVEARQMAKRMQTKLDFYNVEKGYGKEVVGDSKNGYRWLKKKAKTAWT